MEDSTKTFLTKFTFYFLFAILLIGLLLSVKSVMAFTWEGELNPNEFDNWKLVSVQPTPQGYFWVFIENPDQTSAIDVVVMKVDLNSMLRSYRYFKYGEPHMYIYDAQQDKYIKMILTEKGKQDCLKCHERTVPSTPI